MDYNNNKKDILGTTLKKRDSVLWIDPDKKTTIIIPALNETYNSLLNKLPYFHKTRYPIYMATVNGNAI